ncbi:MAG TPA: NapC/NirT family cytochrome c [Thauera sp.]|jgi:cytochrome c-type protein NapC|uniref:NapC/NirT family cytochrome c n=1 Tax=Thauera sp. TaxID=1905334 RepID=UPI000F951B1F|nr:NapC/NirT family cytochrome c [Thauera sp.]RTL31453.1 MAG: Denitrification system component NirT [Rhodocyclaceae bacterium]MCB1946099.1 NapC/NirT family cytochrome c [Thauera sp.]MCP5223857.1 NapC/NirT family cytochrome c [Thauera sp.]HPE03019.1 NapC/NirT family cytochrome c [Thauera sp.]HRV76955.1 NapC/NirT family cytochrome c [Thauera sp.]
MSEQNSDNSKQENSGGLWARLRRPSGKSLGGLLAVGFVVGVLFWGGFNTALEATNTEKFCISCHEMYDNVYMEYKETIHYNNRTGVRATCPDCHVPKDWTHKMIRKVQASKELWGKMVGTIDTREKFEAKRLELARNEWKRMKASDSRECRNCHSFESMNKDSQKQRARKQHEMALEDNMTCIDCHKGIAHHKPEGMTEEDEE